MLVSLSELLAGAEREKAAIGAFNITNWQTAQAVCTAAEETGRPVIMEYAPVHTPFLEIEDAAEIMLYFARKTSVPVGVHLDHGTSLDVCIKGIRLGFTSVMIDASTLPYEENIRESAAVVRAAHAAGVSVEAELGRILTSKIGAAETVLSDSDFSAAEHSPYTDPKAARFFVEQTGVDALAVAFGTAHGIYETKPKLDLDLIKKIRQQVKIPLVMHGGSGLTKKEFQTAVKNGVRKINYYTYMSMYAGDAVKKVLNEESGQPLFFHDIPCIAVEAMKNDAKKVIRIFANKA